MTTLSLDSSNFCRAGHYNGLEGDPLVSISTCHGGWGLCYPVNRHMTFLMLWAGRGSDLTWSVPHCSWLVFGNTRKTLQESSRPEPLSQLCSHVFTHSVLPKVPGFDLILDLIPNNTQNRHKPWVSQNMHFRARGESQGGNSMGSDTRSL